jgi:hypothetical protein
MSKTTAENIAAKGERNKRVMSLRGGHLLFPTKQPPV